MLEEVQIWEASSLSKLSDAIFTSLRRSDGMKDQPKTEERVRVSEENLEHSDKLSPDEEKNVRTEPPHADSSGISPCEARDCPESFEMTENGDTTLARTISEEWRKTADESAPETVPVPTLKDLAKIVRLSTTTATVNEEQIYRVRQMHNRFMEGCCFTFNYNVMLICSSFIGGLGLISNSSATIIASMLVSPIMGPVVGLAYGTTIFDWHMVRKAATTAAISLVCCIFAGMLIALVTALTPISETWPTDEMVVRTELTTLYVSFPVAFFSGLAVAVSLLDDQMGSLVGVAISASLLPPAVNCGILLVTWALFSISKHHSEHESKDFRGRAAISLCLTLSDIVLLWLSSLLMFRMKEVLPIKKRVFWDDLHVARKIYQRRALVADTCQVDEARPAL